jgi:glycosyltransferase involved in cell wall biosynthesis
MVQTRNMKNYLERALIYGIKYRLFGGSYIFKYYLASALLELGFETWLFGVELPPVEEIAKNFGAELLKLNIYRFKLPSMIRSSIYGGFISIKLFEYVIKRLDPDIVFIDFDLYRRPNKEIKIVEYVHGLSEAFASFSPYIKYRNGLWSYYYKGYQVLYRGLARKNPLKEADMVLVNSNYTAWLLQKNISIKELKEIKVLYPPVDVEVFNRHAHRPFTERNGVITLGRIDDSFRLETLVKLAKFISEPIIIVGAISDLDYYVRLKMLMQKEGLQNKVFFHTSVPRVKLPELLSSAKIFINARPSHTFGIAAVEGMATGLPLITVKHGAVYFDVIEKDKYGLSYDNFDELVSIVTKLLEDERTWFKYSKLSIERAQHFSYKQFKEGIRDCLKSLGVV